MTQSSATLLRVENLSKRFGGFDAVLGLSLTLRAGEILGLVGANGAGKTTTFNLISGFLKPTSGKIEFQGEDVTNLSPNEVARKGLVRTFQLNKLFSSLTVEENIRIGCHKYERGGIRRFLFRSSMAERAELENNVERLIRLIGLEELREKKAEDLPYGDQKLLSIGVALGTKPILLMLDEPFAGMNPTEASRCASLVRRILEAGTTIFLVDHNMRTTMGICDRVLVLNFGEKIAEGKPEEIQQDPDVIACYLGSKKSC